MPITEIQHTALRLALAKSVGALPANYAQQLVWDRQPINKDAVIAAACEGLVAMAKSMNATEPTIDRIAMAESLNDMIGGPDPQRNMGVLDGEVWENAKRQAQEQGGVGDFYSIVSGIYRKMGGRYSSDGEMKKSENVGAGARGGQIVGHTANGHPIYMSKLLYAERKAKAAHNADNDLEQREDGKLPHGKPKAIVAHRSAASAHRRAMLDEHAGPGDVKEHAKAYASHSDRADHLSANLSTAEHEALANEHRRAASESENPDEKRDHEEHAEHHKKMLEHQHLKAGDVSAAKKWNREGEG